MNRNHVIRAVSTNFEQGELLRDTLRQMMMKKKNLEKGEKGKSTANRGIWLKFMASVCDGLFNPQEPRLSGSARGDYMHRITRVAERVRFLLFGSLSEPEFNYESDIPGRLCRLVLPTVKGKVVRGGFAMRLDVQFNVLQKSMTNSRKNLTSAAATNGSTLSSRSRSTTSSFAVISKTAQNLTRLPMPTARRSSLATVQKPV